jgi:hypothetical protein
VGVGSVFHVYVLMVMSYGGVNIPICHKDELCQLLMFSCDGFMPLSTTMRVPVSP